MLLLKVIRSPYLLFLASSSHGHSHSSCGHSHSHGDDDESGHEQNALLTSNDEKLKLIREATEELAHALSTKVK